MLTYIYDGSLEGLLTVLALAVDQQPDTIQAITPCRDFQPDLFTETQEIATDRTLAVEFFTRLQAEFSQSIIADLVNCLLSEISGIEVVILDFLRLLLVQGEAIIQNFTNNSIFRVHRTSTQVSHEIERLHGFIRFRQLTNGSYYAAIEPDHNVVRLLAPHFTARFADQSWLIHDLKRQTGIYYDGVVCRFLSKVTVDLNVITASCPFDANRSSDGFAASEFEYQTIWNQYFQAIAIPERTNLQAQKQRMPKRYWKHLVERVES
jgi:probable DNA metabolism protein